MGNNLLLVAVEVYVVGGFNCSVEFFVRREQVSWHFVGVVQIGERSTRVCFAGIQDGLDSCALFGRRIRSDEVVVDDTARIAVVTLEPPSHRSHPSVMELRVEDAEVI